MLPPGRFPAGVAWIELDPERVDVNVHPQKAEVRFAEARTVLDALTRTLAAGLGQSPFRRRDTRAATRTLASTDDALADWGDHAPTTSAGLEPPVAPTPTSPAEGYRSEAYPAVAPREDGRIAEGSFSRGERAGHDYLGLRVLGQIARTYLVCEGPEGLVVLDQHAADERVKFARLAEAHRDGDVEMQRLLMPERVVLSDREAATLAEHERLLLGMGIEARIFGERTALVSGTPALLRRSAPERLLRDALAELSNQGSRAYGDAIDTALATMACHGAIRAGDVLSIEEQRALLTALASVASFSGHCPHGRPILHSVSLDELARRVGRT
ncbi:MAG: hypothetical protein J0L92_33025 [Deltaproteobacteria bacterium]|nr:hypothetical protein [Deltaproteobacteria bacterium]